MSISVVNNVQIECRLPRLRWIAASETRVFETTTVFGTPIDITLSELAIESFFPANEETAALLRRMMGG